MFFCFSCHVIHSRTDSYYSRYVTTFSCSQNQASLENIRLNWKLEFDWGVLIIFCPWYYLLICTLNIRLQNGQSIFSQPHCTVELFGAFMELTSTGPAFPLYRESSSKWPDLICPVVGAYGCDWADLSSDWLCLLELWELWEPCLCFSRSVFLYSSGYFPETVRLACSRSPAVEHHQQQNVHVAYLNRPLSDMVQIADIADNEHGQFHLREGLCRCFQNVTF